MKKIRHLIYFKEMNFFDYVYCIILLISPWLLMLAYLIHKLVLIIVGVIILYLIGLSVDKLLISINSKRYKYLPIDYKLFIILSIFVMVSVFIFLLASEKNIDKNNEFFYFVVFTFIFAILAYLTCCGLFFKGVFSLLYYNLLKIIFPKESRQLNIFISIGELSEYINIYDQKRYLNSLIINFVVYLVAIGYFFLGFMSLLNYQDEVIKVITEFSKKFYVVNFGNTVGLISLVIAIYTATYSQQNKIYDKAIKVYYEKLYSNEV